MDHQAVQPVSCSTIGLTAADTSGASLLETINAIWIYTFFFNIREYRIVLSFPLILFAFLHNVKCSQVKGRKIRHLYHTCTFGNFRHKKMEEEKEERGGERGREREAFRFKHRVLEAYIEIILKNEKLVII